MENGAGFSVALYGLTSSGAGPCRATGVAPLMVVLAEHWLFKWDIFLMQFEAVRNRCPRCKNFEVLRQGNPAPPEVTVRPGNLRLIAVTQGAAVERSLGIEV